MTINKRSNMLFSRSVLSVALASVLLTACGGGGGSRDPDLTPNSFSFVDRVDQELSAEVSSNTITISGIDEDESVAVTISGGEFSINGGTFGAAGSVSLGDTIQLQADAPDELSASTDVVLTVGGVSGTFSISTIERDTTPDVFTFDPSSLSDVELSSEQSSVAILSLIHI